MAQHGARFAEQRREVECRNPATGERWTVPVRVNVTATIADGGAAAHVGDVQRGAVADNYVTLCGEIVDAPGFTVTGAGVSCAGCLAAVAEWQADVSRGVRVGPYDRTPVADGGDTAQPVAQPATVEAQPVTSADDLRTYVGQRITLTTEITTRQTFTDGPNGETVIRYDPVNRVTSGVLADVEQRGSATVAVFEPRFNDAGTWLGTDRHDYGSHQRTMVTVEAQPVETSREVAQPAAVEAPADGDGVDMPALTAALAAIGFDLAPDGTVTDTGAMVDKRGGDKRGPLTHGDHAELLTALGDRQGSDMMRVAGALEIPADGKPHNAQQRARLRMKIRAGVRGPEIPAVTDDSLSRVTVTRPAQPVARAAGPGHVICPGRACGRKVKVTRAGLYASHYKRATEHCDMGGKPVNLAQPAAQPDPAPVAPATVEAPAAQPVEAPAGAADSGQAAQTAPRTVAPAPAAQPVEAPAPLAGPTVTVAGVEVPRAVSNDGNALEAPAPVAVPDRIGPGVWVITGGGEVTPVARSGRYAGAAGHWVETTGAPRFAPEHTVRMAVIGDTVCTRPRFGCYCGLTHATPDILAALPIAPAALAAQPAAAQPVESSPTVEAQPDPAPAQPVTVADIAAASGGRVILATVGAAGIRPVEAPREVAQPATVAADGEAPAQPDTTARAAAPVVEAQPVAAVEAPAQPDTPQPVAVETEPGVTYEAVWTPADGTVTVVRNVRAGICGPFGESPADSREAAAAALAADGYAVTGEWVVSRLGDHCAPLARLARPVVDFPHPAPYYAPGYGPADGGETAQPVAVETSRELAPVEAPTAQPETSQPVEWLTPAQTAALVREALREAFPAVRFSVRCSRGSAMRVHWADGPTEREVEKITDGFRGADFDGMQDMKVYRGPVTLPDGRRVRFGADFIFTSRTATEREAVEDDAQPVAPVVEAPAPAPVAAAPAVETSQPVAPAAQPVAVAPAPVADSRDYPHAAILRDLAGRDLAGRVKVTRRDGAWFYRAQLADGGEVIGRAVWSEESGAWIVCEVVPTVPAAPVEAMPAAQPVAPAVRELAQPVPAPVPAPVGAQPVRAVMPPRVAAALARITAQPVAVAPAPAPRVAQPVAVPAQPVAAPVAPRVAVPAPVAAAPVVAPVAVPAAPAGDRGRYAYAPGTRVRATLREVRQAMAAAQRAPETAPMFAGLTCTVEADRPTVARPTGYVVVTVEAPAGADLAAVWAVVDGIAAQHVPAPEVAAV